MILAGKCAIVTGGGTGVGRATVLRLARLGCSVIVNYSRSRADAESTASEAGAPAIAFRADVREDADCRKLIGAAVDAFGRLDILVNNAGGTRFIDLGDLEAVTPDDWQRIFSINLVGPFQCARAARPAMLATGGGQIVNVSSVAAFSGKGSSIPYAASKAALNNLTFALARALAPRIRVNAVAPGFIDGRWLQEGLGESYAAVKRWVEKKSLLGRVCQPDDVAAAIESVLTGSPALTGQVIVCDNGSLLGK